MLKILGSALVVASGGICGLAVAGSYSRRPRELKSLSVALSMLESEIAYGINPLPEALERVAGRSDKNVALLLNRVARELGAKSGDTAREIWERALAAFYRNSSLTPGDLVILRGLGANLGMSDRQDQLKQLHLAREQLEHEIVLAEEEASKNVKLWSYLGFLGGLLAVIILY